MDRSGASFDIGPPPVRVAGTGTLELVLRAAGDRERREPSTDAPDRRAVPEAAVLRVSAHDPVAAGEGVEGEREAGGAVDAADGAAGHVAGPTYQSAASWAGDLPLPAEGLGNQGSERGVVRRHHLRAAAARFPVPGGDHGLVQPLCGGVGVVEQSGFGVMYFRFYNTERPHSALGNRTPQEVHFSASGRVAEEKVVRVGFGG